MKVDYSKGKIYKITNNYNTDAYVGSTCDTLCKRFSGHKKSMKNDKYKNSLLYKLMNEIGFDRFRIELIEDCPCEDVYQLRQREGVFIRLYGTLNKRVEEGCKTREEYREAKNIKQYNKEYDEKRKDSKKQFNKNYYQEHKAMLLQKSNERYKKISNSD
jgi:hypothetical protein